jgi:hypothetical protein
LATDRRTPEKRRSDGIGAPGQRNSLRTDYFIIFFFGGFFSAFFAFFIAFSFWCLSWGAESVQHAVLPGAGAFPAQV